MIVRCPIKCSTCDYAHIARVAAGFEPRQLHRFPCSNCGEDIVIALVLDQEYGRFFDL
jgi:hypothetical protein